MYENVKVTVFMSCYNHQKYVAEAIESILNQTHRNLELIVVNDGSEDNSADIISSYEGDKRLVFFDLKENTNAVGAFRIINKEIEITNSKYVAAMSSDDKWDVTKLEKQIDFLERHKEYKACFTWDKVIFEDGHTEWPLNVEYSHVNNMSRYQWIKRFFYNGNCINACSMLMDRDCYLKLGGFDWTFRQLQDYKLWLELALNYPFYIMPEQLTFYRRHEKNISTADNASVRDYNEKFYIWYNVFQSMTDDFFVRSFREQLIYADARTHEEIQAEKIILLMQGGNQIYRQIGMMLYMQSCNSERQREVLEEKYGFTTQIFHQFSGNAGMVLEINKTSEDIYNKIYEKSALWRLLDMIETNDMSELELKGLSYSVYRQIEMTVRGMDNAEVVVENIKKRINKAQDTVQNNDSLWIIYGERVSGKLLNKIVSDNAGKKISISICPANEHLFSENISSEQENFPIIDRINHSFKTMPECVDNGVEVILLGCFDKDYPLSELLTCIPLSSKVFYISEDGNELYRL